MVLLGQASAESLEFGEYVAVFGVAVYRDAVGTGAAIFAVDPAHGIESVARISRCPVGNRADMADSDAVAGIADMGEDSIGKRKDGAAMASAVAIQMALVNGHPAYRIIGFGGHDRDAEMGGKTVTGDHLGSYARSERRIHTFSSLLSSHGDGV